MAIPGCRNSTSSEPQFIVGLGREDRPARVADAEGEGHLHLTGATASSPSFVRQTRSTVGTDGAMLPPSQPLELPGGGGEVLEASAF